MISNSDLTSICRPVLSRSGNQKKRSLHWVRLNIALRTLPKNYKRSFWAKWIIRRMSNELMLLDARRA